MSELGSSVGCEVPKRSEQLLATVLLSSDMVESFALREKRAEEGTAHSLRRARRDTDATAKQSAEGP